MLYFLIDWLSRSNLELSLMTLRILLILVTYIYFLPNYFVQLLIETGIENYVDCRNLDSYFHFGFFSCIIIELCIDLDIICSSL